MFWKPPLYHSGKGVAAIGVLGVAAIGVLGVAKIGVLGVAAIGVLGVAVLGNFVLSLYIAIHLKTVYN